MKEVQLLCTNYKSIKMKMDKWDQWKEYFEHWLGHCIYAKGGCDGGNSAWDITIHLSRVVSERPGMLNHGIEFSMVKNKDIHSYRTLVKGFTTMLIFLKATW